MSLLLTRIRSSLDIIQSKLSFRNWRDYEEFNTTKGKGRVALVGCLLGLCLGVHLVFCLQLSLHVTRILPFHVAKYMSAPRMFMLWQWSTYCSLICVFHLLEFFVTAVYNPTQVTAESFLVDHSIAYTAAAITSWTEFLVRFIFFPKQHSVFFSLLGLVMAIVAQTVRSLAMKTAGESFNHYIQISKKDNHILITNGIYSIFRHPSYVGFFYWSVATQLLLGNPIHAMAYAAVSWNFFKRRIAYEEESLLQLFPDEYPDYRRRTWMGIPFLHVDTTATTTTTTNNSHKNSRKKS